MRIITRISVEKEGEEKKSNDCILKEAFLPLIAARWIRIIYVQWSIHGATRSQLHSIFTSWFICRCNCHRGAPFSTPGGVAHTFDTSAAPAPHTETSTHTNLAYDPRKHVENCCTQCLISTSSLLATFQIPYPSR